MGGALISGISKGIDQFQIYLTDQKCRMIFKAGCCNFSSGIGDHASAAKPGVIPQVAAGHVDAVVIASGGDIFAPDFFSVTGDARHRMGCENHLSPPLRPEFG